LYCSQILFLASFLLHFALKLMKTDWSHNLLKVHCGYMVGLLASSPDI